MNFNIYRLKIKDSKETEDEIIQRTDDRDPCEILERDILSFDSELFGRMGLFDSKGVFQLQVAERLSWSENHIVAFRLQKNGTKTITEPNFEKHDVDHHPYSYIVVDLREGHNIVAIEKNADVGRTTESPCRTIVESVNREFYKYKYMISLDLLHKNEEFMQVVGQIRRTGDRVKSVKFNFLGKEIQQPGGLVFYELLNQLAKYSPLASLEMQVDDSRMFNSKENLEHLQLMEALCRNNPEYTLTATFQKFGSYTYGKAYLAQYGMDDDLKKIFTNYEDMEVEELHKRIARLMNWLDLIVKFYNIQEPEPSNTEHEANSPETIIDDYYSGEKFLSALKSCFDLWIDDNEISTFTHQTLFYLVIRALDRIRSLASEERLSVCANIKPSYKVYLRERGVGSDTAENASRLAACVVIECLDLYNPLIYNQEINAIYQSLGSYDYAQKTLKYNKHFLYDKECSKVRKWLCSYMEGNQQMYETTYISKKIEHEAKKRRYDAQAEKLNEVVARMNFDAIEPEWLKTREAKTAWARLHEAGIVDSNCIPLKNSTIRECTIIAHLIMEKFNNNTINWTVFEQLWGLKRMSSRYSDSLNTKKFNDYMAKYEPLITCKM